MGKNTIFNEHPVDKLYFRFYNKFGKKIIEKYRNTTTNSSTARTPSFQEFVRYLLDTPVEDYNLHWAPIYLLCDPCHIPFTAVARTESLDTGIIIGSVTSL